MVAQSEASAERQPFQILDLGWRLGTMVVDQSEASAERLDLNFGVVAGGDGGMDERLLSR